MNDEKRRGRPPTKHLHEDHHFKAAEKQETVSEPENPIVESVGNLSQEFINEVSSSFCGSLVPNVEIGEPPVEEKIHVMVEQQRVFLSEPQKVEVSGECNGWHPLDTEVVIKTPPRNGIPVYVSEKPAGDGICVFWKRLRAFANATKCWQETGAWLDFHTGMRIAFEPKYWKERF